MDQVKFFLKVVFSSTILLGPFLNTLTHISWFYLVSTNPPTYCCCRHALNSTYLGYPSSRLSFHLQFNLGKSKNEEAIKVVLSVQILFVLAKQAQHWFFCFLLWCIISTWFLYILDLAIFHLMELPKLLKMASSTLEAVFIYTKT